MIDVLFVQPNSSEKAYQGLAKKYSAIEPPTWALLLAESCRSVGFGVAILDSDAERLDLDTTVERIKEINPRLVVFVVYGQNPNSGTTGMIGTVALANHLKSSGETRPIAVVGSHASALPSDVLSHESIDIVLLNEGVYAIRDLLRCRIEKDLKNIKGIGYKDQDGAVIINEPQKIVPQELMDIDLPGYAWDLLPYDKKPLDLYRSHFWHAEYDHDRRTPFAAIYTSLGCRFACDFCMINIVNRVKNGDDISAADSRGMRFWSPSWVAKEMRKLADMGVETLRISDEMFFLDKRYYVPILENVVRESYGFNMWSYSRVDTVRPSQLELFKKAGVNWLALGVEAGNQKVRQEVSKGTFMETNIRDVCRLVRDSGISVISNYIFGFPDDNLNTMEETLQLAIDMNTEAANMYPCQALPGSPIYHQAIRNNWALPDSYEGYAFLSYESQPLPTKYLSAADVLSFRDKAWKKYHTNPKYLDLIGGKFGEKQRSNVVEMTKIELKRRILDQGMS